MPITGTLQKITPAKKLMIKITERTFTNMQKRCQSVATKENLGDCPLPTWSFTNDEGEEMYFLMVKLDQYDVQNLRKFERLRRCDVVFDGHIKTYSFIPEGENEQKCGVNFMLTMMKKKQENRPVFPPQAAPRPVSLSEQSFEEIADVITAQVERRKTGLFSPGRRERMTALELAIDGDVDEQVARNLGIELPSVSDDLHSFCDHALERQNAAPPTYRRRRTTCSPELKPIKYVDL